MYALHEESVELENSAATIFDECRPIFTAYIDGSNTDLGIIHEGQFWVIKICHVLSNGTSEFYKLYPYKNTLGEIVGGNERAK